MPINARRWRRLAGGSLIVLVTCGIFLWVDHVRGEERRALYEAILRSYQEVLKPGMNRAEVENYLREKNISFTQMCCAERHSKKSWDDTTKIGQEMAPWFCKAHNVYIAFQFNDRPNKKDLGWDADESDTLSSITIFHRLEGCP